jgi:hypothetical protein
MASNEVKSRHTLRPNLTTLRCDGAANTLERTSHQSRFRDPIGCTGQSTGAGLAGHMPAQTVRTKAGLTAPV